MCDVYDGFLYVRVTLADIALNRQLATGTQHHLTLDMKKALTRKVL
jgi:hypothetical protein